jgi:magnesium-transporting ATPase (P-type)
MDEVYRALGTRPTGLTQADAAERLARCGTNAIREVRKKPILLKFLANFTHLMALLLWVGGAVAIIAQLPQLAIAIWAVNLINGAFSFWQEFRAERATEALRRLLPNEATVVRDGQEQRINTEDLVPGDVIRIAQGDRISADARLIRQSELRVDQSTLTGESQPVRKTDVPVYDEHLLTIEMPNQVFAGTAVAAGAGEAVVSATGMNTEFGRIAGVTQGMEDELSPLQREMISATRTVTIVAVGIGVLFFILLLLFTPVTLVKSFIFALGMIVAFVPEGMLPTVTLSLALAVQRMARRNALVKRLSAVEALGSANVICTDKTGTLTQNEMTVTSLWVGGRALAVSGVGYAPQKEIQKHPDLAPADLQALLRAAALCNNARLLPPTAERDWAILGDPTEAALKVAALKGKFDLDAEIARWVRVRELPFDSLRKRMTTVHLPERPQRGCYVAFSKGAPREVLALCTHILLDGAVVPLDDVMRAQIVEQNDAFASAGLRVLAMAQRELTGVGALSELVADAIEENLTFIGLMAMMDPPRPEVATAVQTCHEAGIRIIMMTGDYGLTAISIARRIGIVRTPHPALISGSELDAMPMDELKERLRSEVVFARVAPGHKLKIVTALQEMGQIVAVTGDGVNDAPALKKADIGVAMGISGTDVAKEAADMILTDDNFASIVAAVEEGRTVYANIKKFLTYIFISNMPEAVPFIAFAFSGGRIPLGLNIMQILAIDLGTDLVPALALGAEAPEPGIMRRPPRNRDEHVITRAMLLRAYGYLGLIQGIVAMIAFYFLYWTSSYAGQWLDLPDSGALYLAATTITLASVVFTQIGNLFAQRTELLSALRVPLFSNRLVWIGIAVELLMLLAIIYLPPLQEAFGTSPFAPEYWLFLLALTPTLLVADEIRKWMVRRRQPSP